ncbi:MAG: hypothetical protein ACE5J4_03675 [Candidatus Aenigmatarchaeota archaeon]
MKGVSKVIWISIAIILGVIVLALIIAPLLRAQGILSVSVSETDLRNCCSNFRANEYVHEKTMCIIPDGKTVSLTKLCIKVRGNPNCDPCK